MSALALMELLELMQMNCWVLNQLHFYKIIKQNDVLFLCKDITIGIKHKKVRMN